MSSHRREPIKHTCPDIDKYIKWIKYDIVEDRHLRNMNEEDLYDAASTMSTTLENCIGYLEELRSSNDILRYWGIGEAGRVDELENTLEELENEFEEYKQTLGEV